jgi:hypothetical protein
VSPKELETRSVKNCCHILLKKYCPIIRVIISDLGQYYFWPDISVATEWTIMRYTIVIDVMFMINLGIFIMIIVQSNLFKRDVKITVNSPA